MAIFSLTRFSKKLPCLDLFRYLNSETLAQKSLQFSTTKFIASKKDSAPLKYSTNKAAKVKIAETIGLQTKAIKYPYSKYVIVGSLAIFLIYFCVLREENDFDEFIKGNSVLSEDQQLLDLKLKLIYCEQNNLPTMALKAKINEIESHIKRKPVFRM